MRDGYWDNNQRGGSASTGGSALDHLNNALNALERQMGMTGHHGPARDMPPAPQGYRDDHDAILSRRAELERQRASRQAAMCEAEAQAARRQIEEDYAYRQAGAYGGQPSLAETGQRAEELRAELASLRAELRRDQHAAMQQPSSMPHPQGPDTTSQFESLRAELESIRNDVNLLARDETIRDLADRWGVMEREFANLPEILSTRDDVNRVGQRVQDMAIALEELPRTIPVAGMEQQLNALAGAVERVAETNLQLPPSYFENVDQRLDEISNAVTGLIRQSRSEPAGLDPAVLDAMESRLTALINEIAVPQIPDMSGLARLGEHVEALQSSLGDVASGKDIDSMGERLNEITSAVHAMARVAAETGSAVHPGVIEELQHSIADIAGRLDEHREAARETASAITTSLDARMNELASQIGQQSQASLDIPDLDGLRQQIARLNAEMSAVTLPTGAIDTNLIASRTAEAVRAGVREEMSAAQQAGKPDTAAMDRFEQRLEHIASQLDTALERQAPAMAGQLDLSPVTAQIDRLRTDLEGRFDAISAQAGIVGDAEPDPEAMATLTRVEERLNQLASMVSHIQSEERPDLSRLEEQMAELASHLAAGLEQRSDGSGADDLRLSTIEAKLDAAGEGAAETALRAAETAIHRFTEENRDADPRVVAELSQRMAELDDMLRSATDRNDQAFGAIHDTLLKVVDHMSNLQAPAAPAANDPSDSFGGGHGGDRIVPQDDVPSLAPADADIRQRNGQRAQRMAPADAAAAAALAALNNDEKLSLPDDSDGPLSAAFANRTGDDPMFGDEEFDDVPLEPNADGPDLAGIIQRVRAEKASAPVQSPKSAGDTDPGKSDFIAAARRAAQAAAADTAVADDSKRDSRTGSLIAGLVDRFKGNRKATLAGVAGIVAAVVLLPMIGSLLSGPGGNDLAALDDPSPAGMMDMAPPASMDDAMIADDMGADGMSDGDLDQGPIDFAMDEPVGESDQAGDGVMADRDADFGDMMEPVDLAMTDIGDAGPDAMSGDDMMTDGVPALPDEIGPIALREAVDSGDAMALYVAADKILAGVGTPGQANGGLNHAGAAPFYKAAAERGYAPAQYRYGNLLEKGTGVAKDLAEAENFYRMAAEKGNASAMHNLGALLAGNSGGQPDFAAAARWFAKAGELGVADSQFNLGILYGLGNGVERDLTESYKWFALAAAKGDTMAADKRDEVAAQLNAEDLQLAEGMVKLWQEKPLNESANLIDIPDEWRTGGPAVASTGPAPDAAEMKKAVRNIQAILNNAGYDAGTVDGLMGERTRLAITAFQKDAGLPPTGNVDEALVQKLLEINKGGS